MKYIKTYESIYKGDKNPDPDIGDYVLMVANNPRTSNFINNTIGRLMWIDKYPSGYEQYSVQYDNIPFDILDYFEFLNDAEQHFATEFKKKNYYARKFDSKQMVDFAKSKEQLELQIAARKYNL